jgi:hypothetical protein
MEVNRLLSNRIHDMSKIGALLDLVSEEALPPDVFRQLQETFLLCRLAYENLNLLGYKIRRYQPFTPATLTSLRQGERRFQTVKIMRLEALIVIDDIAADTIVAMPELRLKQVIYNVCRWLSPAEDIPLRVSSKIGRAEVALIFTGVSWPGSPLAALAHHDPSALYGYLAQKIVSRYGGRLETEDNQLVVILPKEEATLSAEDLLALRQEMDKKGARVEALGLSSAKVSTQIIDKATTLIDPLAHDLLAHLKSAYKFVTTLPIIDLKTPLWSAVRRNLHFFQLLTFDLCQQQPLHPEPVNLTALLASIKDLLAPHLLDHTLTVETAVPNPLLNTDPTYLLLIFIHLTLNALEAMPEDGTLRFQIHKDEDSYIVDVIDEGQGIPAAYLPAQVFDLSFTTKGRQRGLGLYKVKRYIQPLGGRLTIFSTVGQGTRVSLALPIR